MVKRLFLFSNEIDDSLINTCIEIERIYRNIYIFTAKKDANKQQKAKHYRTHFLMVSPVIRFDGARGNSIKSNQIRMESNNELIKIKKHNKNTRKQKHEKTKHAKQRRKQQIESIHARQQLWRQSRSQKRNGDTHCE